MSDPIPVYGLSDDENTKSTSPKIRTSAESTAGMIFALTVVGFIAVLAAMTLIKIGLVWFT